MLKIGSEPEQLMCNTLGGRWGGGHLMIGRKRRREVDFNEVLALFQEWGPQLRLPFEERCRKRYPWATDADVKAWQERCETVRREAHALGEKYRLDQLDESDFKPQLQRRFPELNSNT